MHQTKTSVLYINTNHMPPNLVCGLACIPISTRAMRQQIRLIDNLDSGHMDNVFHSCQPMRKLVWEVWLLRVAEL